jgi:hypothetical protein
MGRVTAAFCFHWPTAVYIRAQYLQLYYGRSGRDDRFSRPRSTSDELTAVANEFSRLRRSGVYIVSVINQRVQCIALFRGRSRQFDEKLLED